MYDIQVHKKHDDSAQIKQLSAKRDWMDQTYDAHAYRCFPVTLTNTLGWGISFPEDISFIWDGVSDSSSHHVKVISGEKYCDLGRANGTISFKTGLVFRSNEKTTLLQMPVPNLFNDSYQSFTTLISTSFFQGDLPCAIKITKPNTIITIKAGTPVSCLVPVSLSEIQDSAISYSGIEILKIKPYGDKHADAVKEKVSQGLWTNFYRDAVDPAGNKMGNHEIKSIRLKVIDKKNE